MSKVSKIVLGSILILNVLAVCRAAMLGDVVFEDTYRNDRIELDLVGYGIKKFLTIKVVGASFYLPEGVSSDQALADIPKRLEVVYLQKIPKTELDRATSRGIKNNVSKEEYKNLEAKIEELNRYWPSVNRNDRIGINYLPDVGMEISVNNKVMGVVGGKDIAFALFAVWVGEHPADPVIKEKLLGIYKRGTDDE